MLVMLFICFIYYCMCTSMLYAMRLFMIKFLAFHCSLRLFDLVGCWEFNFVTYLLLMRSHLFNLASSTGPMSSIISIMTMMIHHPSLRQWPLELIQMVCQYCSQIICVIGSRRVWRLEVSASHDYITSINTTTTTSNAARHDNHEWQLVSHTPRGTRGGYGYIGNGNPVIDAPIHLFPKSIPTYSSDPLYYYVPGCDRVDWRRPPTYRKTDACFMYIPTNNITSPSNPDVRDALAHHTLLPSPPNAEFNRRTLYAATTRVIEVSNASTNMSTSSSSSSSSSSILSSIYMIGGVDGKHASTACYRFDFGDQKWRILPPLSIARYNSTCVYLNKCIYGTSTTCYRSCHAALSLAYSV
jgi:hypothetical protein